VIETESRTRILLIGGDVAELRLAAAMARELGADVHLAGGFDDAMDVLRREGSDLVMIEVSLDVARFTAQLRAERIVVPVLGCGVDAPAAQAVAAVRAGAYDYVPLPPQRDLIAAVLMSIGARRHRLVGDDPALRRAVDYATAFATSAVPMLFVGEGGTGRETLARHVHARSGRQGRFLVTECLGVGAEVIESELFGHAAGAFDGAVAPRAGRLAEAHGGTLLLRNIDALPAIAQARLLAAIDSPTPGSARLMATCRGDLRARVAEGQFRADLLSRLSLVQVELPALRARGRDLARLAELFAIQLSAANGLEPRSFSPEALALLGAHDWPGNVRELENLVHRAVLLASDEAIGPDQIVLDDGSHLGGEAPLDAADLQVEQLVGQTVADVERELILQTLERCGGNRTSASTILGISVRTMRNKLRSFIDAGYPVSPAL
jgi:DNA-binding NtrC family response regulator